MPCLAAQEVPDQSSELLGRGHPGRRRTGRGRGWRGTEERQEVAGAVVVPRQV